jgi:hypothetical protein
MALSRYPQTQIAQPGERKTAVARGETAPAVVEDVVICLGADGVGDEGVVRGAWRGFAAGEEVGARAANGVFDQVGYEECED